VCQCSKRKYYRSDLIYPRKFDRLRINKFTLYRISPPKAVIAIENTRLPTIRESLDQPDGHLEVLEVISGSPEDLQPVFDTMLDNATRICGPGGVLFRYADGALDRGRQVGVPRNLLLLDATDPAGSGNRAPRMMDTKATLHRRSATGQAYAKRSVADRHANSPRGFDPQRADAAARRS